MIYSLTGILVHKEDTFAVIDCNGVGYKCFITTNTGNEISNNIGKKITLYTHLKVKEDAIDLYGFTTNNELNCFKLLISVSGVGSKVAIAILSALKPEQTAIAIGSNDYRTLTIAQGVGPKLAKRIILELKDKLQKNTAFSTAPIGSKSSMSGVSNAMSAMSALEVLGYSKIEILQVLNNFDARLEVEELIKLCLKELSKGV